MEVKLFGGFLCAREALQRMVPRRSGVIAAVSSVHEIIPWSGDGAYLLACNSVGRPLSLSQLLNGEWRQLAYIAYVLRNREGRCGPAGTGYRGAWL